jgi:hypothetical protein
MSWQTKGPTTAAASWGWGVGENQEKKPQKTLKPDGARRAPSRRTLSNANPNPETKVSSRRQHPGNHPSWAPTCPCPAVLRLNRNCTQRNRSSTLLTEAGSSNCHDTGLPLQAARCGMRRGRCCMPLHALLPMPRESDTPQPRANIRAGALCSPRSGLSLRRRGVDGDQIADEFGWVVVLRAHLAKLLEVRQRLACLAVVHLAQAHSRGVINPVACITSAAAAA